MTTLDTSDDALFELWVLATTTQTFYEWCTGKEVAAEEVAAEESSRRGRGRALMLPGEITFIDLRVSTSTFGVYLG